MTMSRPATAVGTESPEFSLRQATAADALCLGVLATQVFLDTYAFAGISTAIANEVQQAFSTEAFARVMRSTCTSITVAVREAALIGFAQTTIGSKQPLGPHKIENRVYAKRLPRAAQVLA